jgi:hypothetical protein
MDKKVNWYEEELDRFYGHDNNGYIFGIYHYENQLARHSQELKEKIQLYLEGIDEFG